MEASQAEGCEFDSHHPLTTQGRVTHQVARRGLRSVRRARRVDAGRRRVLAYVDPVAVAIDRRGVLGQVRVV